MYLQVISAEEFKLRSKDNTKEVLVVDFDSNGFLRLGGGTLNTMVADGSLTVAGLGFTLESNTGIIRSGAGAMQAIVSGVAVLECKANVVNSLKRFSTAKGADVPSTGDLTLGGDGNFFTISGTNTVNGIARANWTAGALIIIQTSGAQTWTNNGAPGAGFGKLFLVGGANVSMTANDLMMLVFDGTDWHQCAPTLVK